ncbi:UNVERIFIED_CONTAM: Retrovirus-related Pol polyprotein from transposon TNT 1-94 [Sesamum latifolium]|uniref:Retrovirus-related Pol polyprotein from transposon TNT 1-94 n=1 Tax=Sesamum latifolium TaxID=2727402 RepID=A0AAW2U4P7_9LAMI
MAFLNGFVEEEIFMDQRRVSLLLEKNRKSVVSKGPSTASSKLLEAGTRVLMKSYGKISGSSVEYLVLYVDDILLIGNDVKMLRDIKAWLSIQFSMKDMGEASYILGIKIYRDRSRRMLGLTQSSYIEKILKRFRMEHSKRGLLPMRHGIKLSKKQSPKTDEELKGCRTSPMLSRRKHSICCPVYQARCRLRFECNEQISGMRRGGALGAVKSILKYLKRIKDMFLIYGGGELILEGYSDASFQSDEDDAKSQSGFVFKLNGGVVAWKSSKQDTTANSTTEAEYIVASEAARRQFG